MASYLLSESAQMVHVVALVVAVATCNLRALRTVARNRQAYFVPRLTVMGGGTL
jgi:hypothetical protein